MGRPATDCSCIRAGAAAVEHGGVAGTPIDPEAVHALNTEPTDVLPPPSEALAEARANRMVPVPASLEGGGGVVDEDMPSQGTLPPPHWCVKRHAIAFLHIPAP